MAKANLEEYLKTGTWNRSWDDNLGSEGELDARHEATRGSVDVASMKPRLLGS